MTITLASFNTLEFAKKLEEAGMEPKIAEAQAELQAEIQTEMQKKFVGTFAEYKPILDELKLHHNELATKGDLNAVNCSLKSEIEFVRCELKTDIVALRCELDGRITKVEGRLDRIEGKLDGLKNDLVLKLGGIMVTCTAVASTILALILNHSH
jgi:hypothetical protein